ncbi:MAG: YihA family ribosome biogenesis GTP-binding protein [Bacteroidetes bacterium]|nr:YihA family ribosome biogenesis GTP-binding protein [Bacteroidota bacterium]
MIIKNAEYIKSSAKLGQCPPPDYPEYAFTGRSNVGKSSLINMLTGRKKLAKISTTPGKTRTINHFLINESWYLVDLPGYGYAKASKDIKKQWNKTTLNYILKRENLICLFVLLDSRHPPQKNDVLFMEFLGHNQIPFVMVFTKTDKLSENELKKNTFSYKKELLLHWEFLPDIFNTSVRKKLGKNEILDFIEKNNRYLKSNI